MIDSFVWQKEPGFKDHGIDGWRCLGGSPNVRPGGTLPPSTNTFGKPIGSYKTFTRKATPNGEHYWHEASESFVKTPDSQSYYTQNQKLRFRILPIENAFPVCLPTWEIYPCLKHRRCDITLKCSGTSRSSQVVPNMRYHNLS